MCEAIESLNWEALGVIAAILALVWQLRKELNDRRDAFERNVLKLELFRYCVEAHSVSEIQEKVGSDPDEIQKVLYEMLREGTLIYNIDDSKYETRSHALYRGGGNL